MIPDDSPRTLHRVTILPLYLHSRTKGSEIDTIETLIPDFFGRVESEDPPARPGWFRESRCSGRECLILLIPAETGKNCLDLGVNLAIIS